MPSTRKEREEEEVRRQEERRERGAREALDEAVWMPKLSAKSPTKTTDAAAAAEGKQQQQPEDEGKDWITVPVFRADLSFPQRNPKRMQVKTSTRLHRRSRRRVSHA